MLHHLTHEEGIESVLGTPRSHTIGILLENILKNNNLSFIDRQFLQLVSTAMGTKATTPYAIFFIGSHEETRSLSGNLLLEKIHR